MEGVSPVLTRSIMISKFNLHQKKPNIKIITSWQETNEVFYAPGALIEVENGKGLLREVFMDLMNEKSYCTLLFGEQPLFQLQGSEYYCPTCTKIMKSGYGLEQTAEFHIEKVNESKAEFPFSEVLESIKPLLGLLESKYYIVLDTALYPTDGNDHLFWETPNEEIELPGTCIYYFRDKGYTWSELRPYFTVATQPIGKLRPERVAYYQQHAGARAIAYYMDGYMTALLDGHHKAMAAALQGEMVNALVIIPCYGVCHVKDGVKENYIGMGKMLFSCEEYPISYETMTDRKRPTYEEQRSLLDKILPQMPKEPLKERLPYPTKELVKAYPNVEGVAYMDLVGDVSEERLDKILSKETELTDEESSDLLLAMSAMQHPRVWEMADYYLSKRYVERYLLYTCIEVLTRLPHSEELDAYLIEQLVEYEEEAPRVRDMILNYF